MRSLPKAFVFHISTLLVGVVFVSCLILAVFTYVNGKEIAKDNAERMMANMIKDINGQIGEIMVGPQTITSMVSRQTGMTSLPKSMSLETRMLSVPLLAEALKTVDSVTSIYAGYNNGDFFMLRRAEGAEVPPEYAEQTRWIVRSAMLDADNAKQMTELYLDRDFEVLGSRAQPTRYDPRQRAWFKQALDVVEPVRTDALWLASDQVLGLIYARRALMTSEQRLSLLQMGYTRLNEAVIGASTHLKTLSELLQKSDITPNTQITIFDSNGELLAYRDPSRLVVEVEGQSKPRRASNGDIGHPALAEVDKRWQDIIASGEQQWQYRAGNDRWLGSLSQLPVETGPPLFLSINVPESELYAQVDAIRDMVIGISALFLLLMVPVALMISRAFARPLERINAEANAIRRFDFSDTTPVVSRISEVNELSETIDAVKKTVRRFIEINMVVASEDNFEHLIAAVLKETLKAAHADSGALFLTDNEERLQLHLSRTPQDRVKTPDESALVATPPELLQHAIEARETLCGRIANQELRSLQLGHLQLEASDGDPHAIALPLLNRQQALTGAMLLLSREPFEPGLVDFITALSSSSAISLETRELIEAQKALFEAFVKLIAGAIDAKSPYTGGHCARVPELTKLLAKAANDADEGVFKEFHIDEPDWEAIHIASWLHDCGKVTTPEYVVDKATKLETIYDRIHEVRTRFEVLRRDAELAYWQGISEGGDAAGLKQQLDAENRRLDEDFAFIAECNLGGEFMAPERVERLKAIAERTWLRTFDDRLGVSHEELKRKQQLAAVELPATEYLLADKPEHQFPRSAGDRMPADNPWGFKLEVPELLYDKGEVYNLSVARGTLSTEERFKINEHIVQTVIMLSQLPFPKHLRQVAEIAGGHHEKMDGTGYPKRLHKEDMSLVARIMAIADIFEALTAVDRPYKKGKTLSEALKIMGFMCKDQHIDPELFRLFLESGIYRQYAEKFLLPEQIDAVDISNYLK